MTSAACADVARAMVPGTPGVRRRLMLDGETSAHESYEAATAGSSTDPLDDERRGTVMLYSSGTTGRPKGVKFPLPAGEASLGEAEIAAHNQALYGFREDMVYLSPAPLYHAAPLRVTLAVQSLGGTVVVMERFDPEQALKLIARERVTHSQWVPTMFVRMLKLPAAARYPLGPVEPRGGDPRRRALLHRDQGADDRLVGSDHRGVLRRHGEHRQHQNQL